ncbi:uncharacterized protein B0H18DRAFT_887721 [Fomitopsis serialis]|uniref:uncharacterized protein n=1 Tax=Fomitopsis serialis TaxID=139415 RepID=UPI002008D930|nr:uncharacterized protein B0H18DRAFT_887721 [Neoantrodia serialis]KAH9913778.1 hypothetical protein B0H18DRAFT_887721 [Neoantrodia serialis]
MFPDAPFVRPGYDDDRTCPACDKTFRTSQGVMAHLSTARSCKWYRKGKNAARRVHTVPEVVESEANEVTSSSASSSSMDVDREDFLDALEHGDLFHFEVPESTHAGIPALDDDEDTRVVEEDTVAGKVIRMEKSIVETWRAYFAEDPGQDSAGEDVPMDVDGEDVSMDVDGEEDTDPNLKWKPFASELDWRVATWVIREDVGQRAINRFLSIPGVLEKLGLTFKDVRQLFMKVDTIPDRATWKTTSLTFPDRLDEVHLVRYRDILEAIKALFGNPAHAKDIVYRPRRVFADVSRTRRIFTEMWTGLWWSAVQVYESHTSRLEGTYL